LQTLLQYVQNNSGLGPGAREIILKQFCHEYGEDLREKLAKFEQIWSSGPGFFREVYDMLSTTSRT